MTLQECETRIKKLKVQHAEIKGLECQVFSRITGFYQPLNTWNKGKKSEYSQRKTFAI